jgi:hypothetical protein
VKPKDIFGLIVRLCGLVFIYNAAEKVPLACSIFFTALKTHGTGLFTAFIMVTWPLLVGVWMLRGAPPVSRVAYPEES